MKQLHIDFETRSDIDLKTRGSYVYMESPHTAPLMASFWFGDEPMRRWLPHQPCPAAIVEHHAAGGMFVAHNAGSFEFQLWRMILHPRYGWPEPRIERFRCTLAAASALGLPRKLEKLGETLNLKMRKDKIGASLITFFSKPRKLKPGETGPKFNEPVDHPEKFAQFQSYCDDDVRTETEADSRMIPLSDFEQQVWELDQKINMRGIRIDRASCIAAIALVDREKARMDTQMRALTGGAVPACSNVAKLTAWCKDQGVELAGVAKEDITEALDMVDLPAEVEAALTLRREAGKSSTSKIKAFLARAGSDDRARGAFVYHGAAPGRWSSTGVNFGNMPRPRAIFDDAHLDPALLFDTIRSGEPDALRLLYGPELGRPLPLVSDAIRGFCWAAPGKQFIAADYSSIQGALCAWLSGEEWKLEAMRALIRDPSLPDLYRRAAARILNTTTEIITKKHPMRQAVGKPAELALGFQGGPAALLKMAANYGIRAKDLHGLYPHIWSAAEGDLREKAVNRWERCRKSREKHKTDVLSREAWLACELIKSGWRKANPKIEAAWHTLEDAIREALQNPGRAVLALGRVTYLVRNGFMWCRLPSDRCIAYAAPKLRDQVWAKVQNDDLSWPDESEVVERETAERLARVRRCKIDGPTKSAVTALGVDSTTQKVTRYAVYGGLAMENLCLGIERDILAAGMTNVERAGYPVVLHVYDEAVAEIPVGFGSLDEFCALMCDIDRKKYDGLPLSASGWVGKRYRK
jgi:DNA polymerase